MSISDSDEWNGIYVQGYRVLKYGVLHTQWQARAIQSTSQVEVWLDELISDPEIRDDTKIDYNVVAKIVDCHYAHKQGEYH
jgi:hypothetical protein